MVDVLEEIRSEISRVVGPAGVDVRLETKDSAEMVRVETSDEVCWLPPEELLSLLRPMPDRAGVLALREEIDRCDSRVV